MIETGSSQRISKSCVTGIFRLKVFTMVKKCVLVETLLFFSKMI